MGTARDQGVRELRSRIGSLDVGKDRDRKRKGGVWVGMLVMIECARYIHVEQEVEALLRKRKGEGEESDRLFAPGLGSGGCTAKKGGPTDTSMATMDSEVPPKSSTEISDISLTMKPSRGSRCLKILHKSCTGHWKWGVPPTLSHQAKHKHYGCIEMFP